jgi:colicin import membrane protein
MHLPRPPFAARLSALLLAFLFHGPLVAAEAPDLDPATVSVRAEKMREEGKALSDAAEARFSEEEIACYQRFLVNRCIDQARQRRVEVVRKARALKVEADRMDLAEKNRRFAERQAEQADVAPKKAIERSEQEARNRADSEARLRELSEKDATRIQHEQEGKSRGLKEAEARNRREAAEASRRADEAVAAAHRAEQAASSREAYAERARKAEEKKAEKARKAAAGQPATPVSPLLGK